MPPVRSERECGITQTAQVAYHLAISSPLKLRFLKDCFFELRVCDLAVRQGVRAAERCHDNGGGDQKLEFHFCPVRERAYPNSRLPPHADRRIEGEAVSAFAHLVFNTDAADHSDLFIRLR